MMEMRKTGTKNEEDILTKPTPSKIDLILAKSPGSIFSDDCSIDFFPCKFSASPSVTGVEVKELEEEFLDQLQDLFNVCEHERETSKSKTYSIKDLDEAIKNNISYKAGGLISILFELSRTSIGFSAQDKEIITPLLVKVIDSITLSIESCVSRYRTRLEVSVLQKRSAIQFLKDNFGDFPVENAVLLNELRQHIEYCIDILDDTIERYQNRYDIDEPEDDLPSAGLYDMPSTHVWWWNKLYCNKNCKYLKANGFLDFDF